MMAAHGGNVLGISKAEYLKRYLDGGSSGGDDGAAKKKKRRKKRPEGKGMRIVDDDIEDWKKEPKPKEEVVEEEEDQPVVAEFVDERPEEVKRMEEFMNTNKWRRIQDDESPEAGRSPVSETRTKMDESIEDSLKETDHISIPEDSPAARRVRHDSPDPSSPQRSTQDSPDFSPPQKERHDSPDFSPPRKGRHDSPDFSPPRKGQGGSPDYSPPRKGRHDSPDLSPPNKGRRDTPDLSPPHKGRRGSPDVSPPRKGRRGSPDLSPPRKGRRGSPGLSPPRKGRLDSPNTSPPRKRQQDGGGRSPSRVSKNDHQKNSPTRRDRYDPSDSSNKHWRKSKVNSYSDRSASHLPSKKKLHSPSPPPSAKNRPDSFPQKYRMRSPDSSTKKGTDKSLSYVEKGPTSKRPGHLSPYSSTRHDSNSDLSPPRKKERAPTKDKRYVRQRDSDSDLSPPRHGLRRSSDSDLSPQRVQRKGSDSDLSPPRRPGFRDSDVLPPRLRAEADRVPSSSQRSGGFKMLSGGRAGLVSADILREEKKEERKAQKENKTIEQDSRNAETVFRDKSGKRRDLKTERDQQLQKQATQDKRDEKYAQWGKGLAQREQQRQSMEDAAREMSKPLARYIDDTDLDRMLREQEREGDPMAKFLKKKKDKEQSEKKERPRYKGPNPPPNRFNILPGYRWDGVDRSNGFENKHFARISEKKAVQESAYKWSVEDM